MGLVALATMVNATDYADYAAYKTAMDALDETARVCDETLMESGAWSTFTGANVDAAISSAITQVDGSDVAAVTKYEVRIPTSG